jgi:hypothetical protein
MRDRRYSAGDRSLVRVPAVAALGRRFGGVSSAGLEQPAGDALERRKTVDEEVLNMSVRKFLKTLGVTAQREIELAVREQLQGGDLQGDETLDATATVTVAGLSRDVVVTGRISLA